MEAVEGKRERTESVGEGLSELLKEVGIPALLGIIGALVLLFLFAQLTEDVFRNEIGNLDNQAALWVHGFSSPFLDAVFTDFSVFGGALGIPLLTLMAFLLFLGVEQPRSAWRVVLAVIGGLIINQALKFLFQRPRPDLWTRVGAAFPGFSFPSGHSTLSFCLFGIFIWLGWRFFKSRKVAIAWTILQVFIIVMVGLSRIYLGAHYPSDVLAGYLSGGFWLLALLSGVDILNRFRGRKGIEKYI